MKDDVFRLAMKHMDVTPTYRPELKEYLTQLSQDLVKSGHLSQAPSMDHVLTQQIQKLA
jgi:hypothetical protein